MKKLIFSVEIFSTQLGFTILFLIRSGSSMGKPGKDSVLSREGVYRKTCSEK
jgi:hypothetical protein